MNTPLSTVKERFESKEKLVEAVKELMTDELWLPRLSADRGGSKGIDQVSNKKLLKLHAVLSEVKEQFGSRSSLIDAVAKLDGHSKDAGYRGRLDQYPVPRLYELYRSGKKRAAAKS